MPVRPLVHHFDHARRREMIARQSVGLPVSCSCMALRLIGSVTGEYGPGEAGQLVGQSDGDLVAMNPREKPLQPTPEGIGPFC